MDYFFPKRIGRCRNYSYQCTRPFSTFKSDAYVLNMNPIKSNTFVLLKLIALILATYVLSCSVIPCCAMDNCDDEASTAASHQDKGGCKGDCSPFFACGSCAGFSITVTEIQIEQIPFVEKTTHSGLYICTYSDYFPSFWQPPRFS
jgi:hypothetical protein